MNIRSEIVTYKKVNFSIQCDSSHSEKGSEQSPTYIINMFPDDA